MYKFNAENYNYEINDMNMLIIRNKLGMVKTKQLVRNFTIVHFSEKNLSLLGMGAIVLTSNTDKDIIDDSFSSNKVNEYKEFFSILVENGCDFLNLKYNEALKYKRKTKLTGRGQGKMLNKKMKESKCTCSKCGHIWYVSENDNQKSEINGFGGMYSAFTGNIVGMLISNKMNSPYKCPSCGSEKIRIK